jgi:hypothetical protein
MYRSDRVDVMKGQHFGIFVHFIAGYLAARDLAE